MQFKSMSVVADSGSTVTVAKDGEGIMLTIADEDGYEFHNIGLLRTTAAFIAAVIPELLSDEDIGDEFE